jgi:hypothetical protein
MMRRLLLGLVVLCLFASCRRAEEEPDAGSTPDAGLDAGSAPDAGAIDAGLDPADREALLTLTTGLGIATSMAAPLIADGEMLRDEGGRVVGATRESMTQTRMESAISGSSVVTPATCATYAWSGLMVSATFSGCTFELTGMSIDGAVSITVAYFPLRIVATFTALTIGDLTVDGDLTLNLGGACRTGDMGCTACADTDPMCAEERTEQRTLSGSLSLTSGTTTVLAIESLTLSADTVGATASGEVTLGTTAMTATDLHWAWGDCLPTSGTLAIPSASTTLTFLATTPATGSVQVQVGTLDLGEQVLFMACAP